MRTIVVLEFEVKKPEDIAEALSGFRPSEMPYFTGVMRIAIQPAANVVIQYLDGDEVYEQAPER